jgi:hypothetical protein
MVTIQIIDGELFYLVYTNTGNNLILVTRSNQLATITNAALKNKKAREKKKSGQIAAFF